MIIFDDGFRTRLLELFTWRRDVRRFRPDPLPPGTLERLIHIACLSPSVGLSQPWRFVIVDDPARRRAIAEVFEACNAEALSSHPRALGDRYARGARVLQEADLHEGGARGSLGRWRRGSPQDRVRLVGRRLQIGAGRPSPCRSSSGWITPASPDAP